ncbi:MAG: DUF5659 domain-containing protein [Syntrophothermus sp.]
MTDYISLRDFYAAAYVLAKMKGSELVNYFRENGATTFVFRNSRVLQKNLEDYFSLKGTIDPLRYSSAIKNLKTIIHHGRLAEDQQTSTFSDKDLTNDFSNYRGEKQ